MIIRDIKVGKIDLPLKRVYKRAQRIIDTPEEIVVKMITDTGEIGFGSAAITSHITGDTEESIIGALKSLKPKLIGREIDDTERLFKTIDESLANNRSVKASLDMCIYDLFGKKYNIPLYKLFGGYRKEIETDITINFGTVEEMVTSSLEAIMKGYSHLKIKCGTNSSDAINRLTAISKAVRKGVTLRVDADQSWRPKEAVKTIRKMEDMGLNLDFIEQPVKSWDIEGLKYVTDNVETEILADESVMDAQDAFKIIQNRGADLINIKLMKCGGFHNALKIINMSEAVGIKCMMGCMLESKIGITAAAALAVGKRNMIKADLDTMLMFKEDSIEGGVVVDNNILKVSDKPGLGIEKINGWNEIII